MTLAAYLARAVAWSRTGLAEFPYAAVVGGDQWRVRINDFPVQALYTLMVNGAEIVDFDDWPPAWRRPDGQE